MRMVSPDSAHSFSVFLRSVSRRLNGMVLMAMEFLTFHNQFVSDFSPDDQDDDFVPFNIIEGTQVSCPQFKLGQGIGPHWLDRFRRSHRLVLEPSPDPLP